MVQKNSLNLGKVVLIGGATATGKSEIAIKLAKEFNGEIISADSMQIYSGFDIGTAKLTEKEMQGIPHHLLSFHDGKEYFSVSQFKQLAENKIKSIQSMGKLPIVVGGTGLYLNALLFNYQFGGKGSYLKAAPQFNFLPIVVERPREEMYNKINGRVDEMIKAGLVNEIKELILKGYTFESIPFRAIGYKEFKGFFENETTLDECIENLKKNSRHYAKRQVTWFKQWKNIAHFVNPNNFEEISSIVKEFLKDGNKN